MSKRKSRKPKKDEFGDVEEDVSFLDNWKMNIPELFDKIQSTEGVELLENLKLVNRILTCRFVGTHFYNHLDSMLDDLHGPIFESEDVEIQREALTIICNLSMNHFDAFQSCAIAFLKELTDHLYQLNEILDLALFTIGFLSIFSIRNLEFTTPTFEKLLDMVTDEKQYSKLSVEAASSAIVAINLMSCCFSIPSITGYFKPKLIEVINTALESTDAPILVAGLDLIAIMCDCLEERQYVSDDGEEEDEPDLQAEETWSEFKRTYLPIVRRAASGVQKKEDQKMVRDKLKAVVDVIDGVPMSIELAINLQQMTITGSKKMVVLDAIRRISGFHFSQTLAVNEGIQTVFGVQLMSFAEAARARRRYHDEIQMDRERSTKERQLDIEKKRKLKDRRHEHGEDDE